MSYQTDEVSRESGSPIEIYDFAIGATEYHHTTGEESVTISATVYTALAIRRDEIALGGEERTQSINIIIPASHAFAQRYTNSVPGDRGTITIRRFHRYDDDTEVISLFKGLVQSVTFNKNGADARILIKPLTGAHSRSIPLFVYSSTCNHVLGQSNDLGGCPVDLETDNSPPYPGNPAGFALKHVGTVTAIVGNIVTVSGADAFPEKWFRGGFAKSASTDYRLILDQDGVDFNKLKLLIPFNSSDVAVSDSITIYAGCDHTMVGSHGCQKKFGVVPDFGGYPFVPTLNPFQTGLF